MRDHDYQKLAVKFSCVSGCHAAGEGDKPDKSGEMPFPATLLGHLRIEADSRPRRCADHTTRMGPLTIRDYPANLAIRHTSVRLVAQFVQQSFLHTGLLTEAIRVYIGRYNTRVRE